MSQLKKQLIEKILNKTACVGVIGLGYVGLPFAVEKAKVGFKVIGIEENPARKNNINSGINYITDVDDDELWKLVKGGFLEAKSSFEPIDQLDIIVICVPTPLTVNLTPDLQYIERVTLKIAEQLRPGQLISLESTTYPGTTEEVMLPILRKSGLQEEKDFFLCHSPERVDPGNKRYTTKNTSKIVGGAGQKSLEVGRVFYEQTIQNVVALTSAKAAEMAKLYENTFRSVNIALVNEFALLCDRMGINVWEVLDAAFSKPFGIIPFYPGPGVGGHCIPIDPHYLEWKAREYNFTTRFIALAGEINRKMPEYVIDKVMNIFNELGKAPSQSSVLILGMAYKKDIDDTRESPAIKISELLTTKGIAISYHDPFVHEVMVNNDRYRSIPLSQPNIKKQDLIVIVTDHSCIDYQWLVDNASAILDTRNATAEVVNRGRKVFLL